MTRLLPLFLFLLAISPSIFAEGEEGEGVRVAEEVIKEIAHREKVSVEDVRKDLAEGCSSGVTQSMQRCAYYYHLASDIALNQTYARLKKQLAKKSAEDKLLRAQRAWIAFRDATCTYETDSYVGGRGEGIEYWGCIDRLTEKRTEQLENYLACKDAGCPGDW